MLLEGLKSEFMKRIFALASGTVAAQIVALIFAPIITRIFGPEIFGLQGIFLSLVTLLSPLAAMRYPMAIVVADNDIEANTLARLSLLIAFGFSLFLWLALFLGGTGLARLVGVERLGLLIYLLPVAIFSVALQETVTYQALRLGAFRVMGIVEVTQAVVINSIKVLLGVAAPIASTLLSITALSSAIKAGMLIVSISNKGSKSVDFSRTKILRLLKTHSDFPRFRVASDVLNAAAHSVPIILLGLLYSPTVAGLYALTRSVLNIPFTLIGNSVGNALYARYGDLSKGNEPLFPLMIKSSLALSMFAPCIIGGSMFAPRIFSLVFGAEWEMAGEYAKWVSVWISVGIICIPAIRVAPYVNAQRAMLLLSVASLIVRVSVVFLGYKMHGTALASIAYFSIASAILNFTLYAFITSCVRKGDRSLYQAKERAV